MTSKFRELLFTSGVLQAQRAAYGAAQDPGAPGPPDRIGEAERDFIAARDSFYLATVGETGWPYVQHRGGPPGFLEVVDSGTLRWIERAGNRQLISRGNLGTNDRVALFLMDYPGRQRLKILGHARAAKAPHAGRGAEAAIEVAVVGLDWNCPKFITARFSEAEVEAYVAPLRRRIAELESRLAARGGSVA